MKTVYTKVVINLFPNLILALCSFLHGLNNFQSQIHHCFNAISLCFAELYYDRGNHHEFVSLVKDLARPGELTQSQTLEFEFTHVEKPYESYTGQNVKLR